jgi:hypothetical protein
LSRARDEGVCLAQGVLRFVPRRRRHKLAIVLALSLSALAPRGARGAFRVAFPYRDADFLSPGETAGAMVVVPDAAPRGERAPLVVLLHGVNVDHGPHMWLGGRGEPDLSAVVERMVASGASRPYILAAPSQTRGAMSGRHMWQDFDLDDFVAAVDVALGGRAEVDRDVVIVLGHSGAGCNPDGGLLRVAQAASRVVPRALLAIDTCMDEESGRALGAAPSSARVLVRWQTEIWPRPIDRFRAVFADASVGSGHAPPLLEIVNGLVEPVHETILADTFLTVIPALVATE